MGESAYDHPCLSGYIVLSPFLSGGGTLDSAEDRTAEAVR
jgi:hypothetical protein